MRRSFATGPWRVALAAVLAMLLCGQAGAAQHETAPPTLRVTVSTSGRVIFDSLLDAIARHARLTDRITVTHADSLDALRAFCQNTGVDSPDVVLSTHRMQEALATECAKNGAEDVVAVELARSALILAVRRGSPLSSLTSRQVYYALAREVPEREGFVRNTSVRWSDIDPELPQVDIRFLLPTRDDGSRAIFDSLVMEGGCRGETPIKLIFDEERRTRQCVTTRSDRVREVRHPQDVRALLDSPLGTIAVLSDRDIAESNGQLVGLVLDGETPSPDAIRRGEYEFITSFWLYAKRGRAAQGGSAELDAMIEHMIDEAQSEELIGDDGPLPALGLIPLTAEERAAQRSELTAAQQSYSVSAILGWFTDFAVDAWHMFGIRSSVPASVSAHGSLDFAALMDIAGYRVTGVESSIGIIPDATMTFSIVREASDSDHAFLDRTLYRDSLLRPGALAAMQRRIIRAIMGVREVGSFEVSKVDIVFLPLPKVTLTVTPKDVLRQQQSGPNSSNSE